MDRHDKGVWQRTIDAVVFLTETGKEFFRGDNEEKPMDPNDYLTCVDSGKQYVLPSGNVALSYLRTVQHYISGQSNIGTQIRHIELLKPDDPNNYSPKGTATVLFWAERSLQAPEDMVKKGHYPPKDRWGIHHVEDRPDVDDRWYDELLQVAEMQAKDAMRAHTP